MSMVVKLLAREQLALLVPHRTYYPSILNTLSLRFVGFALILWSLVPSVPHFELLSQARPRTVDLPVVDDIWPRLFVPAARCMRATRNIISNSN